MARSSVSLSFDLNGFKRDMRKAANQMVGNIARELSTMLNGMSREFKGRPVEEIKPVLQQRWKRVADGSITDPELTEYAEQIAAGGSFSITADELS